MLNVDLVQEKSILIANMLKTGHPVFLLVYTFIPRSFPDKIVKIGQKKSSLTKYSNSYWLYTKLARIILNAILEQLRFISLHTLSCVLSS